MKQFFLWIVTATAAPIAQLNWQDTANPSNSTLYNVYRGDGPCVASTEFALLVTVAGAKQYVDGGVQPGKTYCYQITALAPGLAESDPAGPVTASVPAPTARSATPQQFTVTIK